MSVPIAKILGYSVAGVCAVFSILIFTGSILGNVPLRFRTLFAVIVVLYGVYRAALSFTPQDKER